MKIFLISLTFILMISCTQNSPQPTGDLPNPVVEISPISVQPVKSNLFPENEVALPKNIKFPAFPTSEKISMEDFWRKENTDRLSKFGLYDLERRPAANDDIEVRVWQITDLYMRIYQDLGVKESVFILKRINGNWSARVFRNTINQKTGIEKQIKTKLDVPQSGWENVWQNLINSELLIFPDSVSRKSIPDPDEGICIMESKVDGIFKTYRPAGNREIREIRHTAKILNIIAEEFDLEDFQATKKYRE
ncbi:MAG: hypothetical protein M3Q99_06295 [Acidobacteriota bacterium]|nr:hypothetical protein [Acidobacteriota bacterium]